MTQLPPVKMIKDVLDGLLGNETTTTPGSSMNGVDTIGGVLATYIDNAGVLCAVVGWDLSAAANIGAALGLFPRGAAEDAIENQYVPDNLLDNLNEVSNVLASSFQLPGNPHLRLHESYRPVAAAPADATALLYNGVQRMDLNLEIPGYGVGRVAVAMTY